MRRAIPAAVTAGLVLALGAMPAVAYAANEPETAQAASTAASTKEVAGATTAEEPAATTAEAPATGAAASDDAAVAPASDKLVSGKFEYEVDDGTVTITKYMGNDASVKVPASIDGKPVTAIGRAAFQGKSMKSLSLPEGLQEIGSRAFAACSQLKEVVLPESLTGLGEDVFKDCTGLTSVVVNSIRMSNYTYERFANAGTAGPGITVTFGPKCRAVPEWLFRAAYGAAPKVTKVIIPSNVSSIGMDAFRGCSYLESVVFKGNQLSYIGWDAFKDCTSLKSISFPSSLSEIGYYAFAGCSSLESVVLPEGLTALGTNAFENCGALTSVRVDSRSLSVHSNGSFQYAGVNGKGIDVTFGPAVTKVPARLLYTWNAGEAPKVSTVTFAKGIVSIGDNAFGSIRNWTIKAYEGSIGHDYAKENGVNFKSLGWAVNFTDVKKGDTVNHADDIVWLAGHGITEGWKTGNNTAEFRGGESVARADMAAFLYRMAGSPDYTPSASDKRAFSDVNSSTPHAKEIWWLAREGISRGWYVNGSREFRPYNTVARQDMASFLHRFANRNAYHSNGPEKLSFSDVRDGDTDNHADDVKWLASYGVTKGWKVGSKYEFRGMQPVARQDMAAFLHRLDENVLKD